MEEGITRTLYLVRHAKSDKSIPNIDDFDRPLDSTGRADGPLMADFIEKKDIQPDRIVYSPSVRTTETLELLFGHRPEFRDIMESDSSIYRCVDEDFLASIADNPDEVRSLVMIGHNPTITNIANRLQKEEKFDEVPTCGVIAIELKMDSWSEIRKAKGKLLYWSSPKKEKQNQ